MAHPSSTAPASLYLHFPYCRSKCHYCDFNSIPEPLADAHRYLRALLSEFRARGVFQPRTLFLGGGTPSLIPPAELSAFLDELHCLSNFRAGCLEFTIEANPESLSEDFLGALLEGGVQRLSLGIQALDDATLKFFGRAHDGAQARRALELVRDFDFPRLNVDLILGAPPQDEGDFFAGLEEVLDFHPEHISVYDLMVEPGTHLGRLREVGRLPQRDDRALARLYLGAIRRLRRAGYQQYEVSAFARGPSARCLHNLVYWRNEAHIGLGAGAASFRGGVRSMNLSDPRAYLRSIERSGRASFQSERLTPRRFLAETAMMRLRLVEPLSLTELREVTRADFDQEFPGLSARLERQGLWRREGSWVTLGSRGRRLLDSIVGQILAEAF